MFVRPKEGLKFPHPVTKVDIPAEGAMFDDHDQAIHRLLRSGDLERVEDPVTNINSSLANTVHQAEV